MAVRVIESISSSTSRPWSRNASAMRVATNAALSRTSGGSSEVATTTTVRAMPSGPRFSSRNSRTSRPRSPIRPMTRTSASVPRVIWASRLDLPTPEPAKMPRRWPLPQGTRVSSARTPKVSGWSTRVRDERVRGLAGQVDVGDAGAQRRAAVHRPAEAVEHPAEQRLADGHLQRHAGRAHRGARRGRRRACPAACRSAGRGRRRRPRPAAAALARVRPRRGRRRRRRARRRSWSGPWRR